MLYPLLFKPVYKEMIWGGSKLRDHYGREIPSGHTGESWDITCRREEMGVIENGADAGMTFADWIGREKSEALGTRCTTSAENFPLLIKIIDAQDNLSVQVHPDDGYEYGVAGKNELWYIMEPPKDGELIVGLKDGVTREAFERAINSGEAEALLYRLPVKSGDIVNIPAGLVHALTKGTVVAEIQQNSNITYRMFDYNRVGADGKPRELHIARALAVTDFARRIPRKTAEGLGIKKDGARLSYVAANRHFAVVKYQLDSSSVENADPSAFCVFTCVKGEASVISNGGSIKTEIPLSRSVLIPAHLGKYELRGNGVLVKSFVPDIENDFMKPLREAGYADTIIREHTAIYV
ncbi:MAG: class I mannose-6-phosphate isomerase [Clostridiales bacterium]|jgi:mannose-6-phosphate isomerase|nr:class I mannose-6-phosphate isomerase [Clostridiales bacterium]